MSGHRGGEYSSAELCDVVLQLWGKNPNPVILLTGGEPGIQLRSEFISACHESGITLWVETNGSIPLPEGVDWVTCSPKDPLPVTQTKIDEVKLVFPGDDPARYEHLAINLYLQPLAQDEDSVTKCVEYIRKDPKWRLSLQTHKYISLP
jgi:organic radical activating enzyme